VYHYADLFYFLNKPVKSRLVLLETLQPPIPNLPIWQKVNAARNTRQIMQILKEPSCHHVVASPVETSLTSSFSTTLDNCLGAQVYPVKPIRQAWLSRLPCGCDDSMHPARRMHEQGATWMLGSFCHNLLQYLVLLRYQESRTRKDFPRGDQARCTSLAYSDMAICLGSSFLSTSVKLRSKIEIRRSCQDAACCNVCCYKRTRATLRIILRSHDPSQF
jgi:hypothetical protein